MQPSTLKINDQFISFVPINYNRNRWMNKKELGEKRYFRTDMPNTIHVRSISEVHQAFGLKPPKHPLISVIPITNRFNDIDFGDAFYAFDVYIVALKQGIEGTIYYGRNSYDYQDGTIVFSQPGQSSQFKAHPKNIQFGGWIVAFHPDLIRKSELGKTIDLYSFFSYEVSEALHLSKEEQESLTEITKKIEKEYTQNTDQYSDDLMISNVKLLLDYCTRYYNRQFKTRSTFDKDFVSEFESLLKEYFQKRNPIRTRYSYRKILWRTAKHVSLLFE